MKIDLIGMILNNTTKRCFEGVIIDDDGNELNAMHSLDYMIMEYAKVRNGGESSTVVVPKLFSEPPYKSDEELPGMWERADFMGGQCS